MQNNVGTPTGYNADIYERVNTVLLSLQKAAYNTITVSEWNGLLTALEGATEELNSAFEDMGLYITASDGTITVKIGSEDTQLGTAISFNKSDLGLDTALAEKIDKILNAAGMIPKFKSDGNIESSGILATNVAERTYVTSQVDTRVPQNESAPNQLVCLDSEGKTYTVTGLTANDLVSSVVLSIDADYKLSAILKDRSGNVVTTSNSIDLPLESMIIGGTYSNGVVTLQLKSDDDEGIGNTISFSISDLISGLVNEAAGTKTDGNLSSWKTENSMTVAFRKTR